MTKKSTREQRGKSLEQRFWEKVNKTEGCWLWTSAVGSRGYGIFWVGGGVSRGAHQMAYTLAVGEIPAGKVVMHSCDNPLCVNPLHLSVGTIKENTIDAMKKGRLAFGERNRGGGKLSDKTVAEIKRHSIDRTLSISELAANYGVSTNTIKRIRRGSLWSHVKAAG